MPRRIPPPLLTPGPLNWASARALNEWVREVNVLLGGFSAAPPLQVADDANGVRYSLNNNALRGSVTYISGDTITFGSGSNLILPPAAPGSPLEGTVYWDDSTNTLYVYDLDLGVWVSVGGGVGTGIPQWVHVTKSYTDWSAALTANDIEIYSLPAANVIHCVKVKHSAAFTGGTLSAYNLIGVGISTDFTKYGFSTPFNLFQAPGDTVGKLEYPSGQKTIESQTAATSIRGRMQSTGGNLNQATAGTVEFWILKSDPGGAAAAAGGGFALTDGDKGDVTVSGSGTTWTIDADAVTDGKLRNSGACSVIGRSANSTGDPADISAASDGQVLRRSGGTLGFGALTSAELPATSAVVVATKAADESVTSSTTLQDDDDLQAALVASATYLVTGVLYMDGATTGDARIAYTYSGSTAAGTQLGFHALDSGATATPPAGNLYADTLPDAAVTSRVIGTVGAGGDYPTVISGIFKTSTSGTFKIQWAQGTSSGTATRMRAGSFLVFQRLV